MLYCIVLYCIVTVCEEVLEEAIDDVAELKIAGDCDG